VRVRIFLIAIVYLFWDFALSETGFIGSSQQTISQVSQPQGSSTKTTKPHLSHSNLSPFLFTKKTPLKIRYKLEIRNNLIKITAIK